MTVTEALEKLKTYEQTSFALGHAMGLLYYDGVTVAPKGAAAVRGDTSAELSRIDYQLTTAPETVEMLETLMAAREELDAVTDEETPLPFGTEVVVTGISGGNTLIVRRK